MSKSELSYTATSILSDPPLRADGRGLTDYRPIQLSTGVYPQANGSARIECGGSEVVVGVTCVVSDVEESSRNGTIKCTVTCSPSAYSSNSSGSLDDLSEDLTSILSDVYSHPYLLPPNLVIVQNKKCWTIYVDALVLSDGGNILDILFIGARAAMYDCRIPSTRSVQYKAQPGMGVESSLDTRVNKPNAADFELKDYWDDGEFLKNRNLLPVAITLNMLSNRHYLDSTPLEAAATSIKVLIVYSFTPNEKKATNQLSKVLSMRCFGEAGISMTDLKELLKRGEKYARDLSNALDLQLLAESRGRSKSKTKYH